MDCKFNRDADTAMQNASHPCHKGTLICGEDLSISFLKKKKLKMKQCWAVGFSILEISKYIMQQMYYDQLIPRLGKGNVSVVMSDTDSFLLVIKGWTEEEIMRKLSPVMDFSNLEESHPLHSKKRSRTPGYLKNEVPKNVILEVVALKSKTYAIRFLDGGTKNTAKGVVRSVKDTIPFEQFLNCVERIQDLEVEQNSIRSRKHINQMIRSKKVAFSSFDDKRYLTCPKHSVPYGSFLMKKKKRKGRCYFCAHPNALF